MAFIFALPSLTSVTVERYERKNGFVWSQCATDTNRPVFGLISYELYRVSFVFWLPMAVLTVCQLKMMVLLKSFAKRSIVSADLMVNMNYNSIGVTQVPVWRDDVSRKSRRAAIMIMLSYTICWLPYSVFAFILVVSPTSIAPLLQYAGWLKSLVVLNAVVNPLLYKF